MAKHWTQTRAGKEKLSIAQKSRWARLHNSASSGANEFETMQQLLTLWAKLDEPGQNYILQRLSKS